MPAEARPFLPDRNPPLPALTGLRTLLACNIVLYHFTPPHLGLAEPFVRNAFVLVGFFFLLSGYVLAYNYSGHALTLNPRTFWIARFARLYPVYLLALLLSFQMLEAEWHAHTHAKFCEGVILTPLLLQGWSPTLATFWNTVGWTLSAELLLYATFPSIIRGWAQRLPSLDTPARLLVLFLALWILGMVPHTLYMLLDPDHLAAKVDRYSSGPWLRMLKYSPPAYVCMFLAGITLGRLQLRLVITDRRRFALAIFALAAIVVAFFTAVPSIPYILLHGGLLMPLFGALTIGLSGTHPLATLLSWRPILVVGESTFSLYLLHFNGINLLHAWHVWERLHLASFDPWVSYGVALAIALAAHRWVEQPGRAFLLSRLSPQASPARQAVLATK